MSDRAQEMIDNYKKYETQESDKSARETAAARLYWTGDKTNMRAAMAIWELLGTSKAMIDSYINSKPSS